MLASGVLALYHHVKGEWTPVKGVPSSKSNATLTKAKNGSLTVKVVFESPVEVRFSTFQAARGALNTKN